MEVFCLHGQTYTSPSAAHDTILPKIDTLKSATVKAKLRPRLKGDTIEYSTDHFPLPVNADVEELLVQLPGLHIDPDGTITYNGEKIEYLLVDGENIFGSNPALVTRTFDGSKIAKIQVLDKKSDQSNFTGVDDGIRTKVLNLVLKESAKDGYFGKVEVAGNPSGYFNSNGLLAAFRSKEQFTVLGLSSNTGTTTFNGNSGTSVSFLQDNSDALGANAGIGIPDFNAAATHYANTWNGSSDHLSANYQFGNYSSKPITLSNSISSQPNSIYDQNQLGQSVNQQMQNWLYGTYDWASGRRSIFRLSFHGSSLQGQNKFMASENSIFNDTLTNTSTRTIRDKTHRNNLGGLFEWKMQLGHRLDRIFSAKAGLTETDNTTLGYLSSNEMFYKFNGRPDSMEIIDQRKQIENHSTIVYAGITYTEPLWKGSIMALGFNYNYDHDDPLQITYDRGDGKYQQVIDSLSTHLRTQAANQRATLNIQGTLARLSYVVGNDWLGYNYRQIELISGSSTRWRYFTWLPRLILNYSVNQATHLALSYNMSSQQPTATQLMPIANNNDPLHVTIGNPNLKPGINQILRLEYRRFTSWTINLAASVTQMNNTISPKISTDSLGRQISQPLNVGNGYNASFNCSIDKKIGGIDFGFHTMNTYGRSVNYVNTDLSHNGALSAGAGLNLAKFSSKKYEIKLYTNFIYFDAVSSINSANSIHYWTQSHSGSFTLLIIPGFDFNTNATYTWQQRPNTSSGNTTVLLWNCYIGHIFLANRLVVKVLVNNILDQSSSISCTNALNTFTQTSTNTLGRLWMLSATWHFDKKHTPHS